MSPGSSERTPAALEDREPPEGLAAMASFGLQLEEEEVCRLGDFTMALGAERAAVQAIIADYSEGRLSAEVALGKIGTRLLLPPEASFTSGVGGSLPEGQK